MIADAPPPAIHQDPIPYPAQRRTQMRRYAERHYGIRSWRLRPRVIVQHDTANTSYRATWSTFAANAPDPELGELPGTCAHFVISRRGGIRQLVPLTTMCRHTVGLNHVAIGIEHVGTSDAAVMGNRRQLRASLRLTRWLQARFAIRTRDVIGHSESLRSPHHRERVPAFQGQTHGDMSRATMTRYRRMLARQRVRATAEANRPAAGARTQR